MEMLQKMQAWRPQWKGPIIPAESIKYQKKVIDDITLEQSGDFVSHWGNKECL